MTPCVFIILLIMLMMGTIMTLTSSHWLLAWTGLEINTFAIIPLMTQDKHPRAMEAALKYFLVQSTAAITLLFAATSNAWLSGQWEIQQMTHALPLTMATIALIMKMGLAPLHSWLPEVLQGLNLTTGLILSTWQKLAPLALLIQISYTPSFLWAIVGLLSILIGGWGGLNQTQLRKILAYSSITHLGWIILIIHYLPPLAFMSFLAYTMLTAPIFMAFSYLQTKNMNSLFTSWNKSPLLFSTVFLSLLSLGGLPPFSGFVPKWLILQEMAKQALMPLATMAALFSLLSLYYYLRLSYFMALTMPPGNLPATLSWHFFCPRPFLTLTALIVFSLCLLPILPSFNTFFIY
uniref:NADH-ubiquinone oxidoreductase chain 2 n=1 Tax=Cynopoecilus melanotaenia TaxID=105041 RepID=Q9TD57_CYNML|nr:NADH dehydrogenase subunit II [Cynopoecilus melanotaenia]